MNFDMHRATPTVLTRLLISAIDLYRNLISPILPSTCRFHPTCSQYAREAIKAHGPGRGTWMTLKRLGRCHPLHPGGEDPVR
jgi:putative membrane protein insertion efficiency factor